MAVAVIGGLITSTLLTLVVIPAVYTIFDDMSSVFSRIRHFVSHRRPPKRQPPLTQPVPAPA
jgi:hypothetical protein